ncbi:serum response factor-binding protein 1 [Athalia rosae]|uniref:serum response factor-binding protein 1 n=1 Tax=Athalia rosae TaxID=37344 RepID=UPI00203499EF|nr:serum response factor-binding protein 1 [Athalia rosae]
MSKIEINNEIVLMRHTVRRARVIVIRKLVKQAKLLRSKKGDDKKLEKYKRKADKLGQEVVSMKKIPDDEVTRFSITNQRTLENILSDPKSDLKDCVLARLSHNKLLIDRVTKFKEKFPNYEEHLGPGRRKLLKLKRKEGKQAKKGARIEDAHSESEEDAVDEEEDDAVAQKEEADSPIDNDDRTTVTNTPLVEEKIPENNNAIEDEAIKAPALLQKRKLVSSNKKVEKSKKPKAKVDKLSGISLTNKEGTLKRFTTFLEEKVAENSAVVSPERVTEETNDKKINLEKEVDSFFMTESGDGQYLSVVVPKPNLTEEEEDSSAGYPRKNFTNSRGEINSSRSRNGKFFDKVGYDDARSNQNNNFSGRNSHKFREQRQDSFSSSKRPRTDFNNKDKTSVSESVHPSWAAKKKQQEILKQGFQGKKIVFDDA